MSEKVEKTAGETISNDKNLHYGQSGLMLQITRDRTVRWVNGDTIVRTPGGETSCSLQPGFTVGGKYYRYVSDLTAKAVRAGRRLYQDIHGRYVLDMKNRYPIFDSYDAATENRYFHWYLILEADRMSMVYYDDGTGEGKITEDIQQLPSSPYEILNFWHYLDTNGILSLGI